MHRLWEPLAEKRAPSSSYSAKFSVPYCIAVGFLDGAAGLEQFTEARTASDDVRALAARVEYVIDPNDATILVTSGLSCEAAECIKSINRIYAAACGNG